MAATGPKPSTGQQIDAIAEWLKLIAFRAEYAPASCRHTEALIDEVELAALDLRSIVRGSGRPG